MIREFTNRIIFKLKNPSVVLGKGILVSRKTQSGRSCKIGKNSVMTSSVVLRNNVNVGEWVRLNNIIIDDNSMIETGVQIVGTVKGKIILGKECYIGVNNILDTSDNITIGDFVHIAGPSTGLWCHSSVQMCLNSIHLNDINRDKFRFTAPIIIESNVYIGGNCTIYPGVTIHHHSVIAPNSAVTKNVDAFTKVGGVPAKLIGLIDKNNYKSTKI